MNLGEWRLSSYRFTLGGCRVRDVTAMSNA